MSLYDWVDGWVKDLINVENIKASLELCRDSIRIWKDASKLYSQCVLKMVQPDGFKSIYNRVSAYILYNWEASVTHLRLSFILALSALYNPAFTLLRNSLELHIKGAFFEGLAHKKFRGNWVIPPDDDASRLRRYLINILRSHPSEGEELEKVSAHIFDLLEEALYELRLKFLPLIMQIINWDLLYPLEKAEATEYLNNLYNKLSLNVHEHPDTTDVGRIIMEGGELFEQKPLEKSLRDYLEGSLKLIDIATVLSINIFRSFREAEETRAILNNILNVLKPDFKG